MHLVLHARLADADADADADAGAGIVWAPQCPYWAGAA
jgi:hypothetical protein